MKPSTDSSMSANARRFPTSSLEKFFKVYGIVLVFLTLLALVSVGNPIFMSFRNVSNMFSQWAPAGIMAAGMTLVILTRGFDLSIAANYSLCAVVAAVVAQTYPPGVAFAAAIFTGLTVGIMNGYLVAYVKVNPFITTVGTGYIVTGLALVLTKNAAFIVSNPDFSILGTMRLNGFPLSGYILIGTFLILGFVLHKTVYGEAIYAVGGNYEASRLSGIKVKPTVASAYVVLGGCVGIAGCITASQLSSAQANLDPNIIFDVLTIVVVGGTSLAGGIGSMWRTVVGLGIIATIGNGFILLNISPYYQSIIKGCIIVGALALDNYLVKLKRR